MKATQESAIHILTKQRQVIAEIQHTKTPLQEKKKIDEHN